LKVPVNFGSSGEIALNLFKFASSLEHFKIQVYFSQVILVFWMELAQDRDGWRALVCTVRNFGVP
jgi:hypothetical protein